MSPTGLTKDAGWQIGVSRTVDHDLQQVWDLLTTTDGIALWLGEGTTIGRERGAAYETAEGTRGETRSFRPADRIRLTWQPVDWDHDTTVQVVVREAASGATTITFHQERLASAEEREAQRAHWTAVMDRIVAALDAG